MTAYRLRHHLTDQHNIRILAADYGTLITVHDLEHRAENQDHSHGDAKAGDG